MKSTKSLNAPVYEEILLLTVKQCGEALQVSRGTVWNLMNDGRLPFVKVAGARRIALSDIKKLIAKSAQVSNDETSILDAESEAA